MTPVGETVKRWLADHWFEILAIVVAAGYVAALIGWAAAFIRWQTAYENYWSIHK